jgi:hypothetical protein
VVHGMKEEPVCPACDKQATGREEDLNEIVNGLERLIQFFRIGPSCLGKIRPTPSGPSNVNRDLLNQLVGIETVGEIRGHPQDQGDLLLVLTSQKDDSRTDLCLQLVNKLPHLLWILPMHFGREDSCPFNLFNEGKKVQDLLMGQLSLKGEDLPLHLPLPLKQSFYP